MSPFGMHGFIYALALSGHSHSVVKRKCWKMMVVLNGLWGNWKKLLLSWHWGQKPVEVLYSAGPRLAVLLVAQQRA